ncbi:MAG: hypothetical protein AAB865_02325, partial [Patescibacteria group bacterium]
ACYNYPQNIQNQRTTFFVQQSSRNYGGCIGNRIIYYARVVTPGTYVVEPAYMRSTKDVNTMTHSPTISVTITP